MRQKCTMIGGDSANELNYLTKYERKIWNWHAFMHWTKVCMLIYHVEYKDMVSLKMNQIRLLILIWLYLTIWFLLIIIKNYDKIIKTGCYPNLSFVARKPEPLGTNFKVVCDGLSGHMTYLEVQEGKEHIEIFLEDLGMTSACVARASKFCSAIEKVEVTLQDDVKNKEL